MATYVKRIGGNPAAKKTQRYETGIRWTEGEQEQMARDSLAFMAADPNLSRLEALRQAVNELPVSRRKFVKDMSHSQWVVPLWEKIAAQKDALNAAHGLFEVPTPEVSAEPAEAASEPQTALALALKEANVIPAPASEGVNIDKPHTRADSAAKARAALAKLRAEGKAPKGFKYTLAERRLIAKEFCRLRDAATPEARGRRVFYLETARRAIRNSMPDHRQRDLKDGAQGVKKWLDDEILKVEAEVKLEREEQARLEREAAEQEMRERAEKEAAEYEANEAREREERLQRETAEAMQRAEEAQRAAMEAATSFQQTATIEDLLGLVARRLVRAIIPPFVDELRNEMRIAMTGVVDEGKGAIASAVAGVKVGSVQTHSYIQRPQQQPKGPERERLKRVFVYGIPDIMKHAIPDLEKEYAGKLELSFAHADELNAATRKAAGVDMAVICTDYVSHSGAGNVRASAKEWTKVPGGLSSIRRYLTMYAEGRVGDQPATQTH